jgi:hypothetical protein
MGQLFAKGVTLVNKAGLFWRTAYNSPMATPINNEGAFDSTVRNAINANFASPTSSAAPATATSPGVAGAIAYDSGNIYVCVATNTWKKATIATF